MDIPACQFGDQRSYRNIRDIIEILILIPTLTRIPWKKLNSPPQSPHIAIFLKSGIPIYNSEVPHTAGRKTR